MIVYRELSSLEFDLGYSTKTFYAISNNLHKHYKTVNVPKKNGGFRKLSVPDEILKAIQRRITEALILPLPISKYATAYFPTFNTVRNASRHINKSVVLKLDILNFFDSINYIDIKKKVFPLDIYSEQIRILLTMLCYYDEGLPQGAPSSPAISNVIMADFDEKVGNWCEKQGISYTRYCDDMTFSGDFNPETVISFVKKELKYHKFILNEQKTKILHNGTRKVVTGIVVNEKLSVPIEFRRKLRQEIYFVSKYGVREHLSKTNNKTPAEIYIQQLLGKVNYVLSVNPNDKYFIKAKNMLLSKYFTKNQEF